MARIFFVLIMILLAFSSCRYTVYNCPPKPYLKYQGTWMQEAEDKIIFYEGKKEVATWIIGRDGSIKREGIAINGIVRKFYPDGSLMAEMIYKDNKLNYNYFEYYETGMLKKEGYYVNGEPYGTFTEYDINGNVISKKNFKTKKGGRR